MIILIGIMDVNFRFEGKLDTKYPTIVFISKEESMGKSKSKLPLSIIKIAKELNSSGIFSGNTGSLMPAKDGTSTIILAGTGKKADLTMTLFRSIVRCALLSPYLKKHTNVNIMTTDIDNEGIVALVEGASLGGYEWKKYLTQEKEEKINDKIIHLMGNKQLIQKAATICKNVNFARDMVNENADIMNSAKIEKLVKESIRGHPKVKLEILGRGQMKRLGLNLILAVNSGSMYEPRLIIIRYNGAGNAPYTAIIGKGITFDAGGLNLKPTGYLEDMRQDMGGSAAVLGVLRNVLEFKPKKNLIFALGIAENAIGSRSYKPGDVIKSYSGMTVEIANTDAEGRLVLADSNAYIAKKYKPEHIINIATLTGAVIVALGKEYSGLMSDDQEVADRLLNSADKTDDRAWQLPIYNELSEHVKSKYADIKNTGLPKGTAGTISAGEFLRQFCNNVKWSHLDIGGTAFVTGRTDRYFGYGATGAGVRLLTDFVLG